MRIVIDMQGAQTESRLRGTDHIALRFAQAVVRNRGEHEIVLALNGHLRDSIEPIRCAFEGLLPQANIRVWYPPGAPEGAPYDDVRRKAAQLLREAFLASLVPDIVHIGSLAEDQDDDAVMSIGRFDHDVPVSVSLHDLSPLPDPQQYLDDPLCRQRWSQKIEHLKNAALYLAMSGSSLHEGIAQLGIPKTRFVSMPAARDASWDAAARRALEAWEALHATRTLSAAAVGVAPRAAKPRLAFVSPLPPERTGIADYSAELLPALAAHYEIELITTQPEVADPWIEQNCTVRDVAWLRAHAHEIDRVLYHVGNSRFHAHMPALLQEFPGTVVLHDFFLSGLFGWLECERGVASAWVEALYESHGYGAVRERFLEPEGAARKYPCNVEVLRHAQGLIVHSKNACSLMEQWYSDQLGLAIETVPHLRLPTTGLDKATARSQLRIGADDFVVCSFGFLGSTKLNQRLLDAWLQSSLAENERCHLFFVGELSKDSYGAHLMRTIRASGCGRRIHITGFASPELFGQHLAAADLAVQLRTHSRGETSGTVLDCMNHALPLIVNGNGSMCELDAQAVWMLPDEFDQSALVDALETLWRSPERRGELGERARHVIAEQHAPAECAARYAQAIERFARGARTSTPALLDATAATDGIDAHEPLLSQLARSVALSLPLPTPARRLFLDVSATCRNELKTGIERVVRALFMALLQAPPPGWRIEPVYLSDAGGRWHHRYARRYTLELLGCPPGALDDDTAEPNHQDVLVTLDISGGMLVEAVKAGLFARYRERGVAVHAMVHDLLPVLMPAVFPPETEALFEAWLRAISEFDGAVCVSNAVATDLAAWQAKSGYGFQGRMPFRIGVSHHGADLNNSAPSKGLPADFDRTIEAIRARPTFLMVGTIEPRKAYLQTLEAFDCLWKEGLDANLVIVGKEGWQDLPDAMRRDIPQTVQGLREHPQKGERLFWLEGISDECLEKIYEESDCLVAASYGEGFGLPLIEAARHGLPIIARDIPVFREVASSHALYFKAQQASDMARAIASWLALQAKKMQPKSNGMQWLTWVQSANNFVSVLNLGGLYRSVSSCGKQLKERPAAEGISTVHRAVDFAGGEHAAAI